MAKQKKSVYILGSMLIGIVTVLAVLLILAGTGVIDTKSRDVVFTSSTAEWVYDGTDFTSEDWELTSGELKKGHSAKVTVSGSQLNVGTSENHISVVIVDEQGADVSEGYNIRCIAGTLTVTPCHYELKSAAAEKVYDGKPLTAESYTVVSGELPKGHDITVTHSGTITNVGTAQNTFSALIRDSKNRDVTDNFALVCTPGRLEVTKRAITFKSQSINKVYDGVEVKTDAAEITDSRALVEDQRVEYEFTASITAVGSVQNMFTAKIFSADNAEVTDNYDVSYDIGTFTVAPRPITVESDSATKVYDGSPLTANNVTLVENSLAAGEELTFVTTGKCTDVSIAINTFDVEIKNADGNVTTSNYDITKNRGNLEVKPLEINVYTASDTKPYDGDELTNHGYSVSPEVVGDDVLSVEVTGTRTTVGTSDNTFTVGITNSDGEPKKYNYTIIEHCGTLTVTPITITVRSLGSTGVYSGYEQTNGCWGIVDDAGITQNFTGETEELPGGGFITVNVTGGRTEVGTSANVFSVLIVDKNGDPKIAANYNVVKEEGFITVTQRPVTVRSVDYDWNYDGEEHSTNSELTDDTFEDGFEAVYCAGDTPLVDGHRLADSVKTIATRTEVGVSANHFTAVVIVDGEGNDVTKNYDISKETGILNIKGKSGVKLGGGTNDDSTRLWLYSDVSEAVYLRNYSYGDFDGQYFYSADEYDGHIDESASMNYLTSHALKNGGAHTRALDIKLETGTDFVLPYYAAVDGEYVQESDVYCSGSPLNYTINRYEYDCKDDNGAGIKSKLKGEHIAAEAQYREYVYENYMYVPDSTLAYFNGEGGLINRFKNSNNIIVDVADYLQSQEQSGLTYNLGYDKKLDYLIDTVVGFLRDVKEGICQHYAAAATMLYRALGIPARFVVGYLGYTEADTWSKVTAAQGHAWVEVYIDGAGWAFVEVTGGGPTPPEADYNPPKLTAGETFTIKPVEQFKKYDGTALRAQDRIQGIRKLLDNGYTYSVTVSGSRTEVGYGDSFIESLQIYFPGDVGVAYSYNAADGNIVNNTTSDPQLDFKFNIQPGKLHVYNYFIALKTGSGNKTYNGEPLTIPQYKFINSTKLADGHSFSEITTGSIANVGIASNTFSAKISDSAGNDITDEYRIEVDCGTLEVHAIAVTLRTHGKTVTYDELEDEYDGELTCEYYDILDVAGNIIAKDLDSSANEIHIDNKAYTVICTLNGSQSSGGSSENTVESIEFLDEDGNPVTFCFAISYELGELVVEW